MDIIVDIDGTLADCTHRLHHIQKQPKDWDAFFAGCREDRPIEAVAAIVTAFWRGAQSNNVIFCSGRPEKSRSETRVWLVNHIGGWTAARPLYLRPDNDHRDDDILKRELLGKIRADGYRPVLAIEDRSRVVRMFREEGLICAQVAEGEF
jgi:hypothetical protein